MNCNLHDIREYVTTESYSDNIVDIVQTVFLLHLNAYFYLVLKDLPKFSLSALVLLLNCFADIIKLMH